MPEAENRLAQQAEASHLRIVRDRQASRPAKVTPAEEEGASVTPERARV